jgi:endonuclease/exonuclease/phosphatase (EEP) superfamily protein YafD
MLLVALTALLLALTSLLAYLGRFSWVLDNIASFRPQLTVGLMVLLVLLVLGRWPKTAVFVGLVTLINIGTLFPLFMAKGSTAEEADLRILSFNLLSDNKNFGDVIEYIRSSEADIVVLHEASRPWEEAVAEADLDYEMTMTRPSEGIFGSLVMTPAGAIVTSFGFRLADPRAVEIRFPDGLAVLAVHPLSPSSARRARLRDQQLAYAAEWAKKQSGPIVVVGDFNASPFSYPYRRLRAETGLADSIRGYGVENSFPARAWPILRVSIDHLLYSGGVQVVDRSLGPPLGSDHFPLVVDLSLT